MAKRSTTAVIADTQITPEPQNLTGQLGGEGLEVPTLVSAAGNGTGCREKTSGHCCPGEVTSQVLELVVTVLGGQLLECEPDLVPGLPHVRQGVPPCAGAAPAPRLGGPGEPGYVLVLHELAEVGVEQVRAGPCGAVYRSAISSVGEQSSVVVVGFERSPAMAASSSLWARGME
jgi:hypothetical protein